MLTSVHESLVQRIRDLEPAGLDNLDQKLLSDRIDIKYILPSAITPELLGKVCDAYRILQVNEDRISTFSNIYFDTPEYQFFLQHVKGKPERYKIRHRTYSESHQTFLEIKKKTRKNRTQKLRLETGTDDILKISETEKDFIREYVPEHYQNLIPVFSSSFKRITLLGKNSEEKVTIDFEMVFHNLNGKTAELPYLCLLEIKKAGLTDESAFSAQLKTKGFRPSGFSKYCIGSSLVREMPHTNILKNKLLLIKKLEDEYNRSSGSR